MLSSPKVRAWFHYAGRCILGRRHRFERSRPGWASRVVARYPLTQPLAPPRGPFDPSRMRLHWIVPDWPLAGAGGHTCIFRTIRFLEQWGHHCTIWINGPTRHRTAAEARRRLHEWYFPLEAEVHCLGDQDVDRIAGDAIVATDRWTAYPARAVRRVRHRFYFVLDYEPWFYPMGADYLWAEETYGFGFTCIVGGRWLEGKMRELSRERVWRFDFAYDPQIYFPEKATERDCDRVVFYARASTERRAIDLGLLALELLAARMPQVRIGIFGNPKPFRSMPFPYSDHGVLAPGQLADLYRRAAVGMVFSTTNHSLVPLEMMACGLPVVDLDLETVRAVFPREVITAAPPRPHELAAVLERLLLDRAARTRQARLAQEHVRELDWESSARQVERALSESILHEASGAVPGLAARYAVE